MKNSLIILFFLFCSLIIPISTSQSQISTKSGSFALQNDSGHGSLSLVSTNNPITIILEINVTQLNASLSILYTEKIGDRSYVGKSIELSGNDHLNTTLKTNSVRLSLSNTSNLYANYTADGYYRIQQGQYDKNASWHNFNLFLSTPDRIDLYHTDKNWVDNITISFTIKEIVGGTLSMDYSLSDYILHQSMEKNGSYTFTINTTSISLSLNSANYSRVSGFYSIIDYEHLYTNNASGFSFIIVIGLLGVLSFKVKKKKNHERIQKIFYV